MYRTKREIQARKMCKSQWTMHMAWSDRAIIAFNEEDGSVKELGRGATTKRWKWNEEVARNYNGGRKTGHPGGIGTRQVR